jgi:hypothetical protein
MGKCVSPFRKKGTLVDLPCGKCYDCKMRRISGWSYRLMKEAEISSSAFFLTLTYSPEHTRITPKGYMTCTKRDVQLFMKRLRKLNKEKLRYYAVAEYGGKTDRPHYHIILFNVDVETIETAWELGHIHVGNITEASIGYTMKYISKGGKIPKHINDDRLPEFSLMSKGLGKNYLTEQMIKYHKDKNAMCDRVFIQIKDGKKIALPRYYKDKLYTDVEKVDIAIHMGDKECAKDVGKTREQIKKDMEKEEQLRIYQTNKTIKRYESI